MNTFIISSKKLQTGLDYCLNMLKKEKIDKFDIEILEFEKALGIEDVRSIQKNLYLKPFQGEKKAIVVILPNGATIEAQNSMLKFLEEPPLNTLIYLITNNYQTLLPTILSRTKIIKIKQDDIQKSDNKFLELEQANGLVLAQNLSKDKEEAIIWLESAIFEARERMLESLDDKQGSMRVRKLIHRLELTHYDLKTTNANPRLALENLFLNL